MLGKIVGAVIGERLSRQTSSVNGIGGALLGVGAASVIRRLGPVGLIAAGLGAYALKRYQDRANGAEAPISQAVPSANEPKKGG